MAYAAAGVAAASLVYSVYSGQQAQKAQQRTTDQARQQFDQQQSQQRQQYQDQLAAEKATTASNLATQAQTRADTQAAQKQALDAEKAAIGTNTQTLSDSLANQNKAAFAKQQPIAEGRLNALGLLQSGALPAEQAKYQADLQAQSDAALANYQIGAQGQLTQNTNAASANQVGLMEQNALQNMQNQEQNMAQNFATQNINNQNTAAYQQYLTGLDMARAQSQQAQGNAYAQFSGQMGSGLMNYYGSQQSPNTPYGFSPSMDALGGWRQKGNTDYSIPGTYMG